jgi:hypothetical protein
MPFRPDGLAIRPTNLRKKTRSRLLVARMKHGSESVIGEKWNKGIENSDSAAITISVLYRRVRKPVVQVIHDEKYQRKSVARLSLNPLGSIHSDSAAFGGCPESVQVFEPGASGRMSQVATQQPTHEPGIEIAGFRN